MKKVHYILPFIVALLFACSNDKTDGSFHQVEVASSNVTFTSVGGSGEIIVKTPNVKATSSEAWCLISTSGSKINVTVEPNLSLEERTAIVYMTAEGVSDYQIPVSQSGVKMKTIGMRTLDGAGENNVKFAYEADYPLEVVDVDDSWLQATIDGDSILLSAALSDNLTSARSTILWLIPQGMTAPRIPVSVTQGKRPKYLKPVKYDDYLGEYEIAYTTVNNGTTRDKSTHVELVRGSDPNTYYLKGILKDESLGNIELNYVPEEGIITMTAQKLRTKIPTDPTKDAWILMYFSSGSTVSTNTGNSIASGEFELLDALIFNMIHHTGAASTTVVGGFTLRTYPTGETSGNAAWGTGAANGDANYCHIQFKKIE